MTAQAKDVARFELGDWQAFIGGGLAKCVLAGATTYRKKPIPPGAVRLYTTLLQHARSEILRKLAEQTQATWDLLDRFRQQLRTLKQASGTLRFGEVTQAIVDALRPQTTRLRPLQAEALAFRLDGAIQHLLLDEFQDTSLAQWRILEPIAQQITRNNTTKPSCSFFCVGDVKQAIYGWRGGMAEILNTLEGSLGKLKERPLTESRRSAQPIIDAVNKVFTNLGQFQDTDKCQAGLNAWGQRFEPHTTVKKNVPGYVCLHTGPAQQEGETLSAHRGGHCKYVATMIHDLVKKASGRSIGVLCRKNETVARMIYELRKLKIDASEEGGNSLTDSPAVELMLSLFTLADHPGHSIAWFHLQNSAIKDHLKPFLNADSLARHLRKDLLANGYGSLTHNWATRLAVACNERDLRRLQQLVEVAYGYQSRATLRADDFVTWVRQQRDAFGPTTTVFKRKRPVRQRLHIDRAIIVLRGEQAVDFEQFLLGLRLIRLGAFLELLHSHVGVVAELDVASDASAYAQLLDVVAVDIQHGGGQAIEKVVEENGPERLAFDAAKTSVIL